MVKSIHRRKIKGIRKSGAVDSKVQLVLQRSEIQMAIDEKEGRLRWQSEER